LRPGVRAISAENARIDFGRNGIAANLRAVAAFYKVMRPAKAGSGNLSFS
jgi:hypothetical protein